MAELKQEFAFSLERLLGLGAWVRRPNSFSVLVPVPAKERKKTERLNRFFFFLLVPVRQSRAQCLDLKFFLSRLRGPSSIEEVCKTD